MAYQSNIAYILPRFPVLTQTFVLYEILALQEGGISIDVFPLLRERPKVLHPEVKQLVEEAHYHGAMSPKVLLANLTFVARRPRTYFRTLLEVVRGSWKSWKYLLGGLAMFPKSVLFAIEIQKRGITHIHAHFSNHSALSALVVHRLSGIPFSFTAHGSDLHIDRCMLRQKVDAAVFVVAISEYNRRMIVQESGPEAGAKVHVIHCGIDMTFFKPVSERRQDGALGIVCVGSLLEVKGHTYLIEACRQLRNSGVKFYCHLVGDGPLRPELQRQIEKASLRDKVLMRGALPRTEVLELLRGSDVIVQPSVQTAAGSREGIPVALMEGMALGLPAVASRLSGIPELVEHGKSGLLVAPRNSGEIAEALCTLAADPDLRGRLGRAGREKVGREFDLRMNAAIFSRLLTSSSGAVMAEAAETA